MLDVSQVEASLQAATPHLPILMDSDVWDGPVIDFCENAPTWLSALLAERRELAGYVAVLHAAVDPFDLPEDERAAWDAWDQRINPDRYEAQPAGGEG